jgi:amino acid adenylation domain-containing protein
VVAEAATRELLPAGVRVVDLDEMAAGPDDRPRPAPAPSPDRLCYVMFTSGSEGVPKGAAVPHRVLANLVHWQVERSALPPGAVTAQFAPWSFDVSAQEIFATLGAGGSLVILSEDERRDPALLWRRVRADGVRRLFLPPAALAGFAAAAPAAVPGSLTELNVAGEPLRLDRELAALLERAPHLRLHNQYGPAETHVVTEHPVTDPAVRLPPVGRPVPGATAHVLDDRYRPVPIGSPGELHLGGPAVGRGYLHRPDLTAARFVPDPFTAIPGGRLYRTGDRARWRFDGTLELLGRVDDQVKIRGFRVEPGEIEAAIRAHPDVAAAAVTARGAPPRRTLCASVVPAGGAAVDPAGLRAHLRTVLPDHLVPAVIQTVDRLPLTPSGKIDRRAVAAAAGGATPPVAPARVPPTTTVEKRLAAIWSEVLAVPGVGLTDDFFDLGGHSLLATQVIARIADQLGVEISLRTLFARPTLGALAEAVTEAQAEPAWTS